MAEAPSLAVSTCTIALLGCTLTTDLEDLEGGAGGSGGAPEPPIDSVWSRSFGGTSIETGSAVAVGPDRAVTIVGSLGSQADFGGGPVGPIGELDAYVLRLDDAGTYQWGRVLGGPQDDIATDVVVDADGDTVVTGLFFGEMDVGNGSLLTGSPTLPNLFVVKLDPSGDVLWARRFSGFTAPSVPHISLDPAGNVVLAGGLRGSVDFGGGALTSTGSSDVFLVELDLDGDHSWSRAFGSLYNPEYEPEAGVVVHVGVDDRDNVFLASGYMGFIDILGQRLTAPIANTPRVYLARVDATATTALWVKDFGADAVIVTAAAVSKSSLVLTGNFTGPLVIDGAIYPGSTAAGVDVYVARFDANGAALGATTYPGTQMPGELLRFSTAWSMDVDAQGAVLIAGQLFDRLTLGQTTLESIGDLGFDLFVAKLAADGTPLLAARYGGDQDDIVMGSAFDGAGNILITGAFQSQLQLGNERHTSNGLADIFVAKLAAEP